MYWLLQQGVERFKHRIEAFCLMSNHIHLAIQVAEVNISCIMHWLSLCYTFYINRKYQRIGHLFQGRFRSILVADLRYLNELIRYIHLNPVRAGMVLDPKHYFWSSHRAYLGMEEIAWLSKDRVLNNFPAISDYKNFILKGIGIETEINFKSDCISTILNVQEMVSQADARPKSSIELSELVAKVCEVHNLTPRELSALGKSRRESHARALLVLLVREANHFSLESLGEFLGRDPSGLAKLGKRLEARGTRDAQVAREIEEMRGWLRGNGVGGKVGCYRGPERALINTV